MKIEKLQISKQKKDINFRFYVFLKFITKLGASNSEEILMIESLSLLKSDANLLKQSLKNIFLKSQAKLEYVNEICERLATKEDIRLFDFSLKLHQIKALLLLEAKISDIANISKLSSLDPLSLEYDKTSVLKPYGTRVSGALLALLFFEKLNKSETNFMSEGSYKMLTDLSKMAIHFKNQGLESNQIFMLIFNESIDQSIKSDSGSNYENRIYSVLEKNGIKNITKIHDKNDKSTEYDFFFSSSGRTYGIGAKRTLRERYKQFIKTSITSKIDVSIEITLGLDLSEEKAKTITNHNTYIFVADEIYQSRTFLKKINKIYSVKDLNIKTLRSLK